MLNQAPVQMKKSLNEFTVCLLNGPFHKHHLTMHPLGRLIAGTAADSLPLDCPSRRRNGAALRAERSAGHIYIDGGVCPAP